jgi:hypothetical protein
MSIARLVRRFALVALLGTIAVDSHGFAQAPAPADPIVVTAKLDAEGLSEFLIPIKIDDHTFWCNLDSGGSWVFSMDTAKAQKAGLRPTATGSSAGVGPDVVADQRVRGANAGIGSLTLRNLTIVLRTFPTVAPDMDCVFGLGLLQDYVVEFDYLTPRLRIFEAANFKASATAVAVPFEIDRFRNPFLETRISLTKGNDVRASLLLDTGGGTYSAVLMKPFIDANRVLSRVGTVVTQVADHPGLALAAARLAAVNVGPFEIADPVAALVLTPSAGIIHDGLVGAGFFRRFTVTFDYTRKQMWLEPNTHLHERQPFDASGLEFRPTANGGYAVAAVIPGSPGAENGLKVGDLLLEIDGRAARELSLGDIKALLSRPTGTAVLRVEREGSTRMATLRLKSLL